MSFSTWFSSYIMGDKSVCSFEKLNASNYSVWSFKMRMLLIKEELWVAIEGDSTLQIDGREMLKKSEKALAMIALMVENEQVVHIRTCVTAKAAWNVLKDFHQQSCMSFKIRILKRLFKMEIAPGADMNVHTSTIFQLVEELRDRGLVLGQDIIVSVLLSSLGDEYEHLVTAIEAWSQDRLTSANVTAKLIDEWEKKKGTEVGAGYSQQDVALKAKPVYTCFYCHEPGHVKRFCPSLMYNRNNKESAKESRFKKWYKCLSFLSSGKGDWSVDSGCSTHMCNDMSVFVSNVEVCHSIFVEVANGAKLEAKAKGNVELKIIVDKNETLDVLLHDVLFVPGLECNLVSVRKLNEKGLGVIFVDDMCFLQKDGNSLAIASHDDGLFKVRNHFVGLEKSFLTGFSRQNCVHEWHSRLAHRNLADIVSMGSHGLCVRKCKCPNECVACLEGKMTKRPFPKKSKPVEALLDCVVTDVCGPFPVKSLGHARYFITFTDLWSKYCTVYFMRTKDEAAGYVKYFIERMKTLKGLKPKTLRSDRGGEYVNKEVQQYLMNEGIKFECTVGYAPEQNGVSERKNRTLMDATRTMLFESKFPDSFWAEAVRHANYVINRVTSHGNIKSPFEMFYATKPTYDDIYPFGTPVYVLIPSVKRGKLGKRSEQMFYIGVDENSKGYRVTDTKHRSVRVSREVKFVEEEEVMNKNFNNHDISSISNSDPANQEVNEVFYDALGDSDEQKQSTELTQAEPLTVPSIPSTVPSIPSIVPSTPPSISSPPSPSPSLNVLRRSTRTRQRPAYLNDYVVYTAIDDSRKFEPTSYQEAINCPESEKWLEAMREELESIEKNETWFLTDLPAGRKAVGCKWVFKLKFDETGRVSKYKARLVAQGFSQKYGIDFDEVFAPVANSVTFRMLLSISGIRNYFVKHFDVKTAFLNGTLNEDIYMRQPPGFCKNDQVYKLKKSLYGLKQAARVWNLVLHGALVKRGSVQSQEDRCLYTIREGKDVCFILVHVDDLLMAGSSMKLIESISEALSKVFELKDLGDVKQYLGINILRDEKGNFVINQSNYIDKIVHEAGLKDSKVSAFPLDTGYYKNLEKQPLPTNDQFRKLIGMLLYLSTNSRPDITASIAILSQKVSNPTLYDLNELKRVIRYLKGTRNLGLCMSSEGSEGELYAYSDANWAEDRTDRKSNTGYFVRLNGGSLAWNSHKQPLVTGSSTESEYVALYDTSKEVTWIKRLCKDFNINISETTPILTDSQSCMKIVEHEGQTHRTKHIDTKFHHTKDMVKNMEISLIYCPTEENVADMLTKPLGSIRLAKLRTKACLK